MSPNTTLPRIAGQELGLVGFPEAEGDAHYGFSLIEQGELHLSPYVCTGLPAELRRLTVAATLFRRTIGPEYQQGICTPTTP